MGSDSVAEIFVQIEVEWISLEECKRSSVARRVHVRVAQKALPEYQSIVFNESEDQEPKLIDGISLTLGAELPYRLLPMQSDFV
jgi:hypothetical protein